MIENLHRTKEIGLESRPLLETGDLVPTPSSCTSTGRTSEPLTGDANERIDELYELARRNGAIGGKLVGAGGGGFLLVYSRRPDEHAWR